MKSLINKYIFMVLFVIIHQMAFAQDPEKTVSITVSGSGKTQDEAKQSALRSAIEQAFGAFISSKTEMLNDKVVADQIASVANGNIKSFSILTESQLPDSTWGMTLKAVVSVSKLSSFVEAKGVTIEIKGGMFALNIKQQLLNEQGEIKAVSEMVGLLHEPMQISFDYIIKSSEPKSLDADSKNWEIPLVVTATTNKNMDFCANYCIKTLTALSLSPEEVQNYKSLNKKVFPVSVTYNNLTKTFYLRKQGSINALNTLTAQWEFYTRLFKVNSGMDEKIGIGKGQLHEFGGADYYNSNYGRENSKRINFLTAGQRAASFSWQDQRTLAEIEKMTDYAVKPLGVVSPFKNGGLLVEEKDGNGFVAALVDLGKMSWTEANKACDELVLNGYDDWRLPTIEELKTIYSKLFKNKIGNINDWNIYWSRTIYKNSSNRDNYYTLNFRHDQNTREDWNSLNSEYNVRPVRKFSNILTQVNLTEEELEKKGLNKLMIYEGTYNVSNQKTIPGFKIIITYENEKLFLAFTSDQQNAEDRRAEIKTENLDEFTLSALKAKIQFIRDEKGKVISLKYKDKNYYYEAEK